MRSLTFLIFVFLTFCCWGLYGPVLHLGQAEMGTDGQLSTLRPFICVGVAYFLIAILFPLIVLWTRGEQGGWSVSGFFWSFVAGVVGAVGALGIIMAFKFDGKPVYVMPLVFGCAPIVNTLVTMAMARTFKQASWVFFLGILVVATGAAGVLAFKPAPQRSHNNTDGDLQARLSDGKSNMTPVVFRDDTKRRGDQETKPGPTGAVTSKVAHVARKTTRGLLVALSIFATALCWGSYGPVLHKGQANMKGSRLRPFICVGLAYFVIAVVVPWMLLPYFPEPGAFDSRNIPGMTWSMAAGVVGAIGALGIIYAFNAGGRPIFVMPLVFGMAPVVNTFSEMLINGLAKEISPWFFASLAAVIIGAVMVLVFAPRSSPSKPAVGQS